MPLFCDFGYAIVHDDPTITEAARRRDRLDPVSKMTLYDFNGIPSMLMVTEVSAITPATVDLIWERYRIISSPGRILQLAGIAAGVIVSARWDEDDEAIVAKAEEVDSTIKTGSVEAIFTMDRVLEDVIKHWLVTRFSGVTTNVADAASADWTRRHVRSAMDEAIYGNYRGYKNLAKGSKKIPLELISRDSARELFTAATTTTTTTTSAADPAEGSV